MQKALSLLSVFVATAAIFCLCGCNPATSGTPVSTGTTPAVVTPVSLSITDDPPAGVSVLFFQVSLTAASLQPVSGSPVSLLPNGTPIQIDVTQLQALSAFLNTANVPAGSYSSLTLTFASPQLVIFNASDSSIASTCAVGSVCQLTPALENSATITLSSNPFPVTVAANSPLGLLIDFHLNTIIQPDLSINLDASNGISVAPLQTTAPVGSPRFGAVTGSVAAVTPSLAQFTLQTPDGRSFTISTSSSTAYDDFPATACSAAGFACIAQGQIVQVQIATLQTAGTLLASQVTYVQPPGVQTVTGTIVAIPPLPLPAGETVLQLMLHQNPTASTSLPPGGMATVAVWMAGSGSHAATTFSIDANGFTIPSGLTFASVNDLSVGQTVQVTVTAGTLLPPSPLVGPTAAGEWGPAAQLSFTASALQLEPSQITGMIAGLGSSAFALDLLYEPAPVVPLGQTLAYQVETTAQTNYQSFAADSFSGLANGDLVSVNGWVFPQNGALDPAIGPPIVLAQTVALHPNSGF